MKRNYELDADNYIIKTQEFPFDETKPSFDFPTDFDFAKVQYYTLINGALTFNGLKYLKVQKVSEITQAYQSELNGTFKASATGTLLEYDYSKESQELWKELASSIDAGRVPDAIFPMNITLPNGTIVPHTKEQLQQLFGEITLRKLSLYGKMQYLTVAVIPNATEEQLSTIGW